MASIIYTLNCIVRDRQLICPGCKTYRLSQIGDVALIPLTSMNAAHVQLGFLLLSCFLFSLLIGKDYAEVTLHFFSQVEGLQLRETVDILWREEGLWMATKGLSARLVQSVTFSFFLMLGYETIKRWSVLDEYKDRIRW